MPPADGRAVLPPLPRSVPLEESSSPLTHEKAWAANSWHGMHAGAPDATPASHSLRANGTCGTRNPRGRSNAIALTSESIPLSCIARCVQGSCARILSPSRRAGLMLALAASHGQVPVCEACFRIYSTMGIRSTTAVAVRDRQRRSMLLDHQVSRMLEACLLITAAAADGAASLTLCSCITRRRRAWLCGSMCSSH